MIKTVLAWVAVAMVFAVVILLFINGGGFRSIRQTAGSITSLRDFFFGVASSSTQFQLPGQDDITANLGIDVNFDDTGSLGSVSGGAAAAPTVVLEARGVYDTNPTSEYVSLHAANSNSGPIDVSGWSVVSTRSGTRLVVPLAAPRFVPGSVNRVEGVSLAPGAEAIIYSGLSPIGVSYRENICTVYFPQMQLYSACVREHHDDAGFQLDSWRLYAGSSKEAWGESDTLRLIDGQGRIIDETTY